MTADTSSRTQNIGHGLLKQRSRRLLGNVLRRKMLVDNKDGYNDELQYNISRRGPNYNGKEDEFADALENLKAVQQKILRANAHVAKPKPIFIPPVVFTSTRRKAPRDNNANYISTAKTGRFLTMNGGAPVPSRTVGGDCPKTSARSAISNALFQSMNFKQFKEKSDPHLNKERSNAPQKTQAFKSKLQTVPVPVIQEKTVHLNIRPNRTINLTNRSHLLRTNSAPTVLRNEQGNNLSFTMEAERCNAKNHPNKPSHIKRSNSEGEKEKDVSFVDVKPSDLINTRPTASQFRIKAISISSRPQKSVSTPKRPQNFVSGLSVYRQSPPATLTVSLGSQSRKKSCKSTNDVANASNDTTNKKSDICASPKPALNGKSHVISFANKSSGVESKETRPVDNGNMALAISTYHDRPAASSAKLRKEDKKLPSLSPKEEKVTQRKKNTQCEIPRFYFPKGKPRPEGELDTTVARISEVCSRFKDRMVPLDEMGHIAKACKVSVYWKGLIFHAAADKPNTTQVSEEDIIRVWKRVATSNNDPSSRFVSLLAKPGKNCLDFEDFLPLLKDIVDSHPGLIFLKDAPEFHTRYMNTVIARIFYAVNRSWSGQITALELRKSNFLTVLSLLEEEDDINAITDYFSYEHFYVIYCKFWELDSDHDLVIDKHDLIGYGDGVLSSRLIDRVLSGAVTRWDTSDHHLAKMSYVDFVWFILSEEDKKTNTSVEYWFRCMDLDGDGYISMYEMEYFYEEQSQKLEQLDIEPLPFEDCVCQVFDIVNPRESGKVSLRDLKKCKMAHVFYDTFFNVAKYLNNEQKDPFVATDGTTPVESDWDNFAAEEYELLVAEEQSTKVSDVSNSILEEEKVDLLDDHHPTETYNSLVQSISKSSEDGIPSESKPLVSFSKA